MLKLIPSIVCGLSVLGAVASSSAQSPYDPLTTANAIQPSIELTVQDAKRKREIPLRVYLPKELQPAAVVLFSHGLGGSRDNSQYLGNHLAGRGYAMVFMQHAGSDEAVWKEGTLLERARSLRQAASAENLILRCEDVPAVLDALTAWNNQPGHALEHRLDLEHVGMSGHSFGAQTTQAVAGQAFPVFGQKYLDKRLGAAVAYSPSAPTRGNPSTGFGRVNVPWMLMTGTRDVAPVGDQTAETRLEVYPNLPDTIDKFEIVLFDAEHMAFSDRSLPLSARSRNPNHHRLILALTTAFWDTYLKQDEAAKKWLTGDGVQGLLEPQDRWQFHLKSNR